MDFLFSSLTFCFLLYAFCLNIFILPIFFLKISEKKLNKKIHLLLNQKNILLINNEYLQEYFFLTIAFPYLISYNKNLEFIHFSNLDKRNCELYELLTWLNIFNFKFIDPDISDEWEKINFLLSVLEH